MVQSETPSTLKQPKTTIAHSLDMGEGFQQFQGVNNMNEEFKKDFLLCEGVHKLILKIEMAKMKGELNPRFGFKKEGEEVSLDAEVVRRMKMIWYGRVKFVIQRYPKQRHKVKWRCIWYDHMPKAPSREIWDYPSLRGMNPVYDKNESTWGRKIRELIKVPQAFERCDPQQVVLEGHFYKQYSDKIVPYFNKVSDIHNSKGMTDTVSDNYFNITIANLIMTWLFLYAEIWIDIHKIIRYLRLGSESELDEDEDKSSFSFMAKLT